MFVVVTAMEKEIASKLTNGKTDTLTDSFHIDRSIIETLSEGEKRGRTYRGCGWRYRRKTSTLMDR